ncbi:hypothetical protein OUZ56_012115 [Daphnia magna]|uniref:Uncharacterized protein n=1 Tax=Daphnia magna TaxID=35525 RepID=A0ABQ9Z234_9CRUS|nr:hypothetical protein OUZ56_012115 [Daphnia magna]
MDGIEHEMEVQILSLKIQPNQLYKTKKRTNKPPSVHSRIKNPGTYTKHGPRTASLIIMFKALVRSRIDYVIMVFGTLSQNMQKKLEAIQNLIRKILNAPQSTLIKEMVLELDL